MRTSRRPPRGLHAVVVGFSKSRRRYERQGLLVEAEALKDVLEDLGRTSVQVK